MLVDPDGVSIQAMCSLLIVVSVSRPITETSINKEQMAWIETQTGSRILAMPIHYTCI